MSSLHMHMIAHFINWLNGCIMLLHLLHSEIFADSLFLCSCAESQSVPLYLDVETSSFYSELNCAQVRKQLSPSDLYFGLRSVTVQHNMHIWHVNALSMWKSLSLSSVKSVSLFADRSVVCNNSMVGSLYFVLHEALPFPQSADQQTMFIQGEGTTPGANPSGILSHSSSASTLAPFTHSQCFYLAIQCS